MRFAVDVLILTAFAAAVVILMLPAVFLYLRERYVLAIIAGVVAFGLFFGTIAYISDINRRHTTCTVSVHEGVRTTRCEVP